VHAGADLVVVEGGLNDTDQPAADLRAGFRSLMTELEGKHVLVVGAGKMGDLSARHLKAAGISELSVVNRTEARAVELAAKLGGRAAPWDQLDQLLAKVDIVLCSTGATEPILRRDRVAKVMRARKGRWLFLIDIAVPRDVEPDVGSVLHDLAQTALRVGKRVHSDTGIDKAGASVVSVALDHAEEILGELAGHRAVIVGAGSMGALAGASLRRRGVTDFVIANRSLERAERLSAALGGRAVGLAELEVELAGADLLVSSTGASGLVVDAEAIGPRAGRPLVVLDLALPRDVSPAVGDQPAVSYIDIEALRNRGAMVSDEDVRAATAIVSAELGRYLAEQQQLAVAPTVTAVRARANQVIEGELSRLDGRLPGLDSDVRSEVADAVRRAVEKVLHTPTVRVKELAATPGGDQYASALRELFGLDPARAESVAAVKTNPEAAS
jgi:glutamyl-tRNA reductase